MSTPPPRFCRAPVRARDASRTARGPGLLCRLHLPPGDDGPAAAAGRRLQRGGPVPGVRRTRCTHRPGRPGRAGDPRRAGLHPERLHALLEPSPLSRRAAAVPAASAASRTGRAHAAHGLPLLAARGGGALPRIQHRQRPGHRSGVPGVRDRRHPMELRRREPVRARVVPGVLAPAPQPRAAALSALAVPSAGLPADAPGASLGAGPPP
jgi:hypothetical protein